MLVNIAFSITADINTNLYPAHRLTLNYHLPDCCWYYQLRPPNLDHLFEHQPSLTYSTFSQKMLGAIWSFIFLKKSPWKGWRMHLQCDRHKYDVAGHSVRHTDEEANTRKWSSPSKLKDTNSSIKRRHLIMSPCYHAMWNANRKYDDVSLLYVQKHFWIPYSFLELWLQRTWIHE